MTARPYTTQLSIYDALQRAPRFDGPDLEAADHVRLTGQLERIVRFMRAGDWHTLGEIAAATHDPEASISSQLRHLRKARFGSNTVERRRRGDGWLYEYGLAINAGGAR
jgi:hypothetical protein